MNVGPGKVKFKSLSIILDSRSISSIIWGKHMQKLRNINIKQVCCSTQGSDLYSTYISKVDILLSELDAKIMLEGISM